MLILDWWHSNDVTVSASISGPGVSIDVFVGSILFADEECIEIGGLGLMLSIDFSTASGFSWGEESDESAEFDPATFDSVFRFKSDGKLFALGAAK